MKTFVFVSAVMVVGFSQAQDFATAIQQRQEIFEQIEEKTELVEDLLNREPLPWQELTQVTSELSNDSAQLSDLFPEGSASDSRAKNSIWNSQDKFVQLLTELQHNFSTMRQAAMNKEDESVETALNKSLDNCKSCHRKYRSLW